MPNWCDNSLSITGDEKQIAELKERAVKKELSEDGSKWKTDFSIENFIPIPALLKRTSPFRAENGETEEEARILQASLLKEYGADTWYDWCVKMWGTKWDIEATLQYASENSLQYSFQSAWSPPVEAIVGISQQYPRLTFSIEYEETGIGFYGNIKIVDGEVVENDSGEIEYEKDPCPECGELGIRANTNDSGVCEFCSWHK